MESEKVELIEQIVEWWLPETGGWEKWSDFSQRIVSFCYKMSQFWGYNVQYRSIVDNS